MSPLYNWGAISCQKNRFGSLKTCFVITGTFRVIIGTISGKSKFNFFMIFFMIFRSWGPAQIGVWDREIPDFEGDLMKNTVSPSSGGVGRPTVA